MPLNELLRKILHQYRDDPRFLAFRSPVDTSLYPDYFDFVTHPIDLATIEEKCRNDVYQSVDEFKADVEQIHKNAASYCVGRHQEVIFEDALPLLRI